MIKKSLLSFGFLTTIVVAFPAIVSLIKAKSAVNTLAPQTGISAQEWAENKLASMSLEEKIGQFFMVAAYSNQGEVHLAEVEQMVLTDKVGGIIFFQGEKSNLKSSIQRFQAVSKVPLLIGMDAEWGTSMRLFDGERFPYAYTIGAADSVELSEQLAVMMAQECQDLGIHMNFSPVADVNSNPNNPVIGFRSFGENPKKVADHVKAFVRGMEGNGIMTSIKHFPGHGNTDKDSHLELPTVSQSLKTIEAIDFYPFIEGINAGSSSVMIGHLNVPALDDSGVPSSLSKKIIQDILKGQLGFKGLVISDALNMKAVADKYGKTDVVVKAFVAGCDILLFPESVSDAISAIKQKVNKGEISKKEIDERCMKILLAKHQFVVNPKKAKIYSDDEKKRVIKKVYERATTVLKNENSSLPIDRLDKKIARVSIGTNTLSLTESIKMYGDIDHFHYYSNVEAIVKFAEYVDKYDQVILTLHASTVRPRNNYGFGDDLSTLFQLFNSSKNTTLVLFGNPLVLNSTIDLTAFKSVVLGYENNANAQLAVTELLFGANESRGKLPFTISSVFPREYGVYVPWGGRLKFSQPEEIGVDPKKLEGIDKIALNGIEKGAFPGCQILVACEGKIIYRKSFGTQTYTDTVKVKNTDVYDIASISKIAGSTCGVMRLQTLGKFSLNNQLKDYIPEVTGSGSYGDILIRDMMAHQAGLTAWIPFYKRTLKNGKPNPGIYSTEKKTGFEKQVAEDIWIRNDYTDSIYKSILSTPLGPKKYEYSDLGYYFIKKIVEKQSGKSFQEYLMDELYLPLGLRSMRYQPRLYFPIGSIVPTENDQAFRGQLVHGFVHDPGAAMLGGVGGHAGLFSNATDLASLMQLLLNKGRYGNVSYIDESVVDEFTKAQFTGNRRGAGFDRPTASGGGPCHESASQVSFGHSGFTGTLVWVDPKYNLTYVFLSNRVCPDQDNWKIRDMNIRTEIQRVIYEAITTRDKK
jgi:beta-glucosidase-like glycosyl hydrolase/CubicO group peptidase (beta-lactamase class C family)